MTSVDICLWQFLSYPLDIIAKIKHRTYSRIQACADPEGWGGQGVRTPLKNHQNIGFLSNIGPDPLKNTKLPSQHTTVGHYQPVSETPFKWRFAGGPMMARLY